MIQLEKSLEDFLVENESKSTESVSWRGGQIQLLLSSYVTEASPPDHLSTSGRCIILGGSKVLVMENPGGMHILPGGRREAGESILEATIREVAEETGLTVEPMAQLGILVFRHQTPKPTIYAYPYPVFINAVYLARVEVQPEINVSDTYEMSAAFVDCDDVLLDSLPRHQSILLTAALGRT
jgi:ADP-ribose pyrophosphatase YjhB (NUDIX family)